ncbi:MAG: alpha/beta hydrolase [Marivita sp.]|uniref:alpha/beta fold hydrolase n=1 Tax=Marivita sp. TaxID=2003365 RepID=UPI001B2CC18D|nr:alpha/beta hydrolase [Marivita sp.]MBO6882896.1 alpha/beta hydrolase [Marivita sp.]
MPHDVKVGFPVFIRSFGHGPEPAVLLHCALAHSKIWTPLATLLSDRLSMTAPDMPSHGRSAPWDHRGDLHDQVTTVARDCLGDGGHVIGHSFGATVALRVAIEEPDKVRSLTLIEPVLFAAAKESNPEVFQSYVNTSQGFGAALAQGKWACAAANFIGIWGDGRSWDSLSEKEQAAFSAQMPFILETEPCLIEDANGLLAEGRPEMIRCPTRLIRGSETEPVIEAIHATLERRIPNAVDVVVDGAGHMVPISHPDAVAKLVAEMIGG